MAVKFNQDAYALIIGVLEIGFWGWKVDWEGGIFLFWTQILTKTNSKPLGFPSELL